MVSNSEFVVYGERRCPEMTSRKKRKKKTDWNGKKAEYQGQK